MAPRRAGDPMTIVAAADRIRELLGWTPEFDDLDTIVGHALAWARLLNQRTQSNPRMGFGLNPTAPTTPLF